MSSKDNKLPRAALRDFLRAVPDTLDRASDSMRWLALLAALALVALVLHWLFAPRGRPHVPPPGGAGDNPVAALYVRDLGRLPDGRHSFDLVYELVLRNATMRPFAVDFSLDRLALGDVANSADVAVMGHAPPLFAGHAAPGAVVWHSLPAHNDDRLAGDYPPGRWRAYAAHYRVTARADQIADVAIGYGLHSDAHGWFAHPDNSARDAHDEEVQLGAVLRAHCPLGIKVQNGEVRSLCAP